MTVVNGGEKCNLIAYYNKGDDDALSFGWFITLAQSFTLEAQNVIYQAVVLLDWMLGEHRLACHLHNADAMGMPIGAPISVAYHTYFPYGAGIKYEWRIFKFTDFPLLPPGQYAIELITPLPAELLQFAWRHDSPPTSYPLGKAWRSINSGSTFSELVGYDFMFEIWGWQPPPAAKPTPVISNWAPLTIADTRIETGFEIVVTTDIPVHLYMRWTDKVPLKHPLTEYRRGILIQTGTRYCFVSWHENEQLETGDTLIHTFWKENWPVCQTRYFYFIGSKQAEEQPSASPIFIKHRTEPPVEDVMYTFNSIEPQRIPMPAGFYWQPLDLSFSCPERATGALIHLVSVDVGADRRVGFRKPGSTMNTQGRLYRHTHTYAIAPLDANRRTEVYGSPLETIEAYIMGFTGPNVKFLDEPVEVTNLVNNVWQTRDVSAYCPGAKAVIVDIGHQGYAWRWHRLRPLGSSAELGGTSSHNWAVVGLDVSGRFQIKSQDCSTATKTVAYVTGYITNGITMLTDPIKVTPTWAGDHYPQSLAIIDPTPRWGLLEFDGTLTSGDSGCRKRFSPRRDEDWGYRHHWAWCHNNEGLSIELYVSSLNTDWWLWGITK